MTLILNIVLAATMFLAQPVWETVTIYWNDLDPAEQAETLRSSYVPSNVREYYSRTAKPSDDEATLNVLKTVSEITPPWQKRALYLHTFVRILDGSDGALGEAMNGYCLKIMKSDPEYVIYYLKENPRIRRQFVEHLAGEFYLDSQLSFADFKTWLTAKFRNNPDLGMEEMVDKMCDDIEFRIFELGHN